MNTRPVIESSNNPVALSASFNQDASCFTVALDSGFCVFTSDPCQLRDSRDFNAGLGAVKMIGKSNVMALIGGGKQPRYPQTNVIIWDDLKRSLVAKIPLLTTVRGVQLSRKYIVVALQNSIRVYNFSKKPDLWAAFETADNPLGLCCIGTKILVFPGRTPGQVQIVELETRNVSIIPAHSSSLRALDVSQDGEVLATASENGTLVRVFATSNCARIAELRRGVDPASIYSVSFSPGGHLLAVTSDKSTLHIFDIPHPSKPPRSEMPNNHRRLNSMGSNGEEADTSQKWGILGRIPLLPRVFSDIYSFASVHFEIGDEQLYGTASALNSAESGFRPPKGIIGWVSDDTIIVIGAGRDARWEKFAIREGEDGKRICRREGWKRYLGVN